MTTKTVWAAYFSATNTTKKVVTQIARRLSQQTACPMEIYDFTHPQARKTPKAFAPGDLVVFGTPVYAGRVPNLLIRFVAAVQGNGALAVPVVCYGNRNYDDALMELRNTLEAGGFHTVAGGAFSCQHAFSLTQAAGRPDRSDLTIASGFADQIFRKVEALTSLESLSPVAVKGNDPVMLLSPADFLWISNGNGTKALYCDGSDLLLPAAEGEWQVRAQSWGHVNFDDVRQPSLHMGSGKGIEGAACIVEQQEITDLWYIFPYPKYRRQNRPDLRETDRILATTLNSWSYPSAPMDADFERKVYFRPDCDCFWLQLEYPDSQVTVFVNDQPVGVLQPGVSLLRLNLPEGLRGGATLRLHTVRRFSHTTLGRAHLLSGRRIAEGSMSGADVNVWRNIRPAEGGKAVRLPVSLSPGQEVLLSGILPEGENRARTLVLEGSGIEATLVAHGHVCGRVELKTEGYPEVRGGSSRRVYLPKGWSDESVCLHLCGIGEGGALTAVRWEEIQR